MVKEKNLNRILGLSLDIGMRMLVSGAQISRVEDSLERMCTALGASTAHVFSVTSGIIVTVMDDDGNSATQMRRVRTEKLDLTMLEQLNQLSRDICSKQTVLEEIPAKLDEIDRSNRCSLWILLLAYAGISASLSVFFGAGWTDALVAAVTGITMCLLQKFLGAFKFNRMLTLFGVSLLTGLCNALLVRLGIGCNYNAISIGNIMLLIPGIAMTNAIHDMFVGDMISGISRFCQSLVTACIVTFGFTIAGMLV